MKPRACRITVTRILKSHFHLHSTGNGPNSPLCWNRSTRASITQVQDIVAPFTHLLIGRGSEDSASSKGRGDFDGLIYSGAAYRATVENQLNEFRTQTTAYIRFHAGSRNSRGDLRPGARSRL